MCYQIGVVSSYWHYSNLGGQRATIGVMGGSEETPLSAVRSSRMEGLPSEALGMIENSHLI